MVEKITVFISSDRSKVVRTEPPGLECLWTVKNGLLYGQNNVYDPQTFELILMEFAIVES